jgi:acid phosphatase type 7
MLRSAVSLRSRAVLVALLAVGLAVGCVSHEESTRRPGPNPGPSAPAPPGAVSVLAAGDIAHCGDGNDEDTVAIVDRLPGTVLALGDLVYEEGGEYEFSHCYAPSWGRHRDRTRPAVGNHEYEVEGASGYFEYFGSRAGERGKGWYSFDLGGWHLIALNSNCDQVGCEAGSEQERWLRADLAANPAYCTLAYWHHPRFSSGRVHGSQQQVAAFWAALYEAKADLVLSAHEHNYERFAPLDAAGRVEEAHGIQQFVVGTGGADHYSLGRALPGVELSDDETYGVLQLMLGPNRYTWRFLGVDGASFTDSGSRTCH